jgi:hypothetical protein
MTVDASKGHRLILMLDVLEHVAAPERLGRRAGLVTLESRYMFQSLVVPKLLVRAREALTSESAHVPRIPRPALNRAIQRGFGERTPSPAACPFGGSLMTIVTRPAPDSEKLSR